MRSLLALALACVPLGLVTGADAAVPEQTRVATTWKVGPTRALKTPSAAAAVAHDGDTVEIDAGTYRADVATWTQDDLTLRGVGGFAHLQAAGASAQGKAIWVIAGDRTRVEWIEFSGAAVPDRNGAGIRAEGAGLTVLRSRFHDNENGILSGANPASDIVVRRSRFVHNGYGDGYSHNIYIGNVRSFTFTGNYVADARSGNQVKSRARVNTIRANRILDHDTDANYSIDLPNGGDSTVAGNVIQQGPNSPNRALISYGAEGLSNPVSRLWVVNNTMVNEQALGTFVVVAAGTDAHVWNTLRVGAGTLVGGTAEVRGTVSATPSQGFASPATHHYRLTAGSPAISAGVTPPSDRAARYEYRRPSGFGSRPLIGRLDAGAFEYRP